MSVQNFTSSSAYYISSASAITYQSVQQESNRPEPVRIGNLNNASSFSKDERTKTSPSNSTPEPLTKSGRSIASTWLSLVDENNRGIADLHDDLAVNNTGIAAAIEEAAQNEEPSTQSTVPPPPPPGSKRPSVQQSRTCAISKRPSLQESTTYFINKRPSVQQSRTHEEEPSLQSTVPPPAPPASARTSLQQARMDTGSKRPSVQQSVTHVQKLLRAHTSSQLPFEGAKQEDSKQPESARMEYTLPNQVPTTESVSPKEALPMATYLEAKMARISDKDVRRILSLVFCSCVGINFERIEAEAQMLSDIEKYIASRHDSYITRLRQLSEDTKHRYIQERMNDIFKLSEGNYCFSEKVLIKVLSSLLQVNKEFQYKKESTPCCVIQ